MVRMDFFPTMLDLAGLPLQPKLHVDGQSLLPHLKGDDSGQRTFYWHYPLEKKHFLGGRYSGAIRHRDWKLIEYFDTGEIELYNLVDDIGEKNNLANKNIQKKEKKVQ